MKGKLIFIFIFIVMLMLPTIVMLSPLENKYKSDENRKLAVLDITSFSDVKNFAINFKNFYTDNFGLRFMLFSFYKENISKRFNESPSTNNVIYGKKDWLFLGDKHSSAFTKTKGNDLFNSAELNKISKNINDAKEWCNQNNIQFYITIVPGKHTIYKEFLPYKFPKQKTKLDQLVNLNIIDLRKEILEAKDNHILYFKTDTHWNQFGAFVGYQKIMSEIENDNQAIKKLTESDISYLRNEKKHGDLNNMIGIDKLENKPIIVLKNVLANKIKSNLKVPYYHTLNPNEYEIRYYNTQALNKKKIIILRDSFATDLANFFSLTFKETLLIYNHYFEKELITKEKPDFLLYEITERFADRLLTIHEK